MVNTRSSGRGENSQPEVNMSTAVVSTTAGETQAIVTTTTALTATTPALATNAITATTSVQVAPITYPRSQDWSSLFNGSDRQNFSVSSPKYSPLTGLNIPQNFPHPPPPVTTDPAVVSQGVREIINAAVGLAQVDFRNEEEERMRRWIPLIVEATRRSLANSGAPENVSRAPTDPNLVPLSFIDSRSSARHSVIFAAAPIPVAAPQASGFTQPPIYHPPPTYQPPTIVPSTYASASQSQLQPQPQPTNWQKQPYCTPQQHTISAVITVRRQAIKDHNRIVL